ncbi:conserved hypothetical protein [Pediculus humanus corporis]|uniref:Uncharacterized protein n=1 Tax=Pediculus humanus subsp. corporis TaxID=121224 RepID=E0VHL7_PEDHC|nr:uncharacterized protein Phum_PHUM213000 [Pediculus humanus corporis]EEB12903.1 conserved hypothetical protein [Pediculus humanus corporis]
MKLKKNVSEELMKDLKEQYKALLSSESTINYHNQNCNNNNNKNNDDDVHDLQPQEREEMKNTINDVNKDDVIVNLKEKYVEFAKENVKMKNILLDLKNQISTLTDVLSSSSSSNYKTGSQGKKLSKEVEEEEINGNESKRKKLIKSDVLNSWTNLYGIKTFNNNKNIKRNDYDMEEEEEGENHVTKRNVAGDENKIIYKVINGGDQSEKLELIKLRREISLLKDKMTNEKSLRQELENQINYMNTDINEKKILENEIKTLKRKINNDKMQKSDFDLIKYQKELYEKQPQIKTQLDVELEKSIKKHKTGPFFNASTDSNVTN